MRRLLTFSHPCRKKNKPAIITPVAKRRSESGSGVMPTTPDPTPKAAAVGPVSAIKKNAPGAIPEPPEKLREYWVSCSFNEQIAAPNKLAVEVVSQVAGWPLRKLVKSLGSLGFVELLKRRSKLVKVWFVSLNPVKQAVAWMIVGQELKLTANGSVLSMDVKLSCCGGSRTLTW